MKLPDILIENFEMICEGKQDKVYRLNPYQSIVLCLDTTGKIKAKYCMVNHQFVRITKNDKILEESELIYQWTKKKR